MTELRKDPESGLPLEMKTPKGTILPLMVMDRSSHVKWCKAKPCKDPKHWTKTYQNYLQVAHRLVWFREEHPDWAIETEFVKLEQNFAVARARIFAVALTSIDPKTGNLLEPKAIAVATKQENSQGFSDFIEKAETGAVGRALAMCGYGTQFSPELDEGDRLADSPTSQKKAASTAPAKPVAKPKPAPPSGPEVSKEVPPPEPSGQAAPAKAPQSAPRKGTPPAAVSASPGGDSSEGLSLGLQTKIKQNAHRAGYLSEGGDMVDVPEDFRAMIGRPKEHTRIGISEPIMDGDTLVPPLNTAEAAMLAGLYFKEPQVHGAKQEDWAESWPTDKTAESESMLKDKDEVPF
jgi:hypothetical protein